MDESQEEASRQSLMTVSLLRDYFHTKAEVPGTFRNAHEHSIKSLFKRILNSSGPVSITILTSRAQVTCSPQQEAQD